MPFSQVAMMRRCSPDAQRNLGLARLKFDGLRQLDHFASIRAQLNLNQRLAFGLEEEVS